MICRALVAVVLAATLPSFVVAREGDDLAARKARVRDALRVAAFAEARADAERLEADAPGDVEALTLYGDALWADGLFDEAERAYVDAASRAPVSPRARYGVARSLAMRSRTHEALDATLASLAAAPDDPDVHALAGSLYERLNRYRDAADEYERYAGLMKRGDPAAIETARARATLLRAFDRREPLAIEASGASAACTIPFTLVDNKVVVQGRLNGSRVDWTLDTGAERTAIAVDTARRGGVRPLATTLTAGVGTPRLRRVQVARLDRIDLGSLRIRNVPASIRDPAPGGPARWQADTLSPIALGLSVVVDYRRREVTLAQSLPDEDASASVTRLPMRLQRLPLVRGVLNATHPAYFIVDTGGELMSIGAETANALGMRPARRIALRVFGLSGPDDSAFLLPGVDLEFAGIGFHNIGMAVLNLRAPSVLLGFRVGGIVGHRFLGGYRVSMDLARSELRLGK